jgi:D-amino-acid dehydrogenase
MKHVVVIGGGVVGLTTAWSLLESGCAVSLVERESTVGQGASYANGGQLSYRFVSPLADGGVPFKALKWLFEPDAPLQFKPQADWQQWSWLASFLSNCRGSVNQRTSQRLLALGALSQATFTQMYAGIDAQRVGLRAPGKLVIYRTEREFARSAARLRGSGDAVEQVLTYEACLAVEPALRFSPAKLVGGIFTSGEAVADCHAFTVQLEDRLRAHPGFRGMVHAQAQGFVCRSGRAVSLQTNAGEVDGDDFIIAAGLQSRALAGSVGIDLPIYPLKGYSLTAPIEADNKAPEVSVTDMEKKVLYARIGSELRVAAMADLVGEDLRIDPQRMASLYRTVRATFPQAACFDRSREWAGLRPATPSGAPVLGATPVPGIWLNVGHGALGFTLSFGSARVLADLVTGKPSPIQLDGLALHHP